MMAAEMRSSNVSVTPINMDGACEQQQLQPPYYLDGADNSLDAEVARIDFAQAVHMRTKKQQHSLQPQEHGAGGTDDVPRPMSWEGELSDGEDRGRHADMCVDDNSSHQGDGNSHLQPDCAVDGDDDDEDQEVQRDHDDDAIPPSPENLALTGAMKVSNASLLKEKNVGNSGEFRLCYSSLHSTPGSSPLMSQRHNQNSNILTVGAGGGKVLSLCQHAAAAVSTSATPSPDSAIHSAYSVFSSPSQSPLTQRHVAVTPTPPSLSRNNSDASHSSCCSYSSVSASPSDSPVQGRHHLHQHHSLCYRGVHDEPCPSAIFLRQPPPHQHLAANCEHIVEQADSTVPASSAAVPNLDDGCEDKTNIVQHSLPTGAGAGISRQQLINSPCPICGDKISGFHYGIFSCESCKGFFKRTVQNRKNYVCLRGAVCPVTVATRKKCPACRFEKCLQCGMKLEAIREDRTRGGRSTYQCSYTLPATLMAHAGAEMRASNTDLRSTNLSNEQAHHHNNILMQQQQQQHLLLQSKEQQLQNIVKLEPVESSSSSLPVFSNNNNSCLSSTRMRSPSGMQQQQRHHSSNHTTVPPLLQEIMDVEHLWHYSEGELTKLSQHEPGNNNAGISLATHPLLATAGLATSVDASPDFVANLCNIADHRLYKIVKWCKSLPLFKNISIDDQICLLINSWCELLLFSCCYRSMATPGEIRVSLGKRITLTQARALGLHACIERMLHFTEHLRRLRVDRYEYVAMKVIVLLTSDTSELREAEKVRASQEKALQALQGYTLTHYPDIPAKFGELLLRIPELQRTCQVGKDMLTVKSKEGEGPSFNLLMELLRGDH